MRVDSGCASAFGNLITVRVSPSFTSSSVAAAGSAGAQQGAGLEALFVPPLEAKDDFDAGGSLEHHVNTWLADAVRLAGAVAALVLDVALVMAVPPGLRGADPAEVLRGFEARLGACRVAAGQLPAQEETPLPPPPA